MCLQAMPVRKSEGVKKGKEREKKPTRVQALIDLWQFVNGFIFDSNLSKWQILINIHPTQLAFNGKSDVTAE